MSIHYVNPADVNCDVIPARREIEYQMRLLEKQGMIEPLLARRDEAGTWHISTSDWPYAPAQVTAALVLGWPTVILTDDNKSD